MAAPIDVRVQREDFDLAGEVARATAGRSDIGAVVTFGGLCRDEAGALGALELEHYPGMAQAEIRRIAERAAARWELKAVTVIHRYGRIVPGENIVLVVTASSHRHAAFESASFLMDFLKSNAPFWKKEHAPDGRAGDWVDAREADGEALRRWSESVQD